MKDMVAVWFEGSSRDSRAVLDIPAALAFEICLIFSEVLSHNALKNNLLDEIIPEHGLIPVRLSI